MDGYVYSDTFKFVFSEELYKRPLGKQTQIHSEGLPFQNKFK